MYIDLFVGINSFSYFVLNIHYRSFALVHFAIQIVYFITLTLGGCGAVMRSRLGFDTREEDVDEDAISLGSILPPNNDVIERAAESLDPGINPPGGNGGGGGGSFAVPCMSDESLLCWVSCCMMGC